MICSYSMSGSETKVLPNVGMAYQDAPMETMIYVQIETTERAQMKNIPGGFQNGKKVSESRYCVCIDSVCDEKQLQRVQKPTTG